MCSNQQEPCLRGLRVPFQSLSRDSVCSNFDCIVRKVVIYIVSIPQSGFCVLKPRGTRWARQCCSSFNPSVGILCAQTRQWRHHASILDSFNPSVGILCAQTPPSRAPGRCTASFNPSVGILCAQTVRILSAKGAHTNVSIPQSGFCVLKPCSRSTI